MTLPLSVTFRLWVIRGFGALLLSLLLYQSWYTARINLLAESDRPEDLNLAVKLDPGNPSYVLRRTRRNMYAEISNSILREDFGRILQLNPYSAEALIGLGTLAEARGDNNEAEQFLVKATIYDHTLKPTWALANFYYRTNQQAKMWPAIKKALDITTMPDTDFFDPGAIYDLCWQTGVSSSQLLALVPNRPSALRAYFAYLILHHHLDAAVEVFPRAIVSADSAVQFDRNIFTTYCAQLVEARRINEAVEAWNRSIEKGLVASTELRPNLADSIANPLFKLPFETEPFGWRGPKPDEITMTYAPGSVVLDFTGHQPETSQILAKHLAVLTEKDYLLTWDLDRTGIRKPTDPADSGLTLHFSYDGGELPATCSAFFAPPQQRGCRFRVPRRLPNGNLELLNMTLLLQRVAGNVRLQGSLQLNGFHLAFANGAA